MPPFVSVRIYNVCTVGTIFVAKNKPAKVRMVINADPPVLNGGPFLDHSSPL